jgi:trehalose 6-phosphate synthase
VSRLVNVSNRVATPRKGIAMGGLAVGILQAMQARGGLWFGWSGQTTQEPPEPKPALARRGDIQFATLDLQADEFNLYYGGFCNGTLWPLCHYFLDTFRYSDEEFAAYVDVNRRLATSLVPLLRDDDVVWVHDYQLIPMGEQLRDLGVTQPIGFFLHVPFPHIEALRALPVHREIMQMLLAYDLIGLQTHRDAEALRSAAVELWGRGSIATDGSLVYRERRIDIGVFPIGVDVDGIQQQAAQSQARDSVRRFVTGLRGRRCVIGVDRLDYSKGLVERFRAYEQFLLAHPEHLNEVTLIQIAPLSRAELRSYAEIRRQLEQAAGRTNGRLADTDWTPIRYLNRNFPHEDLMGFLRYADVGLVTPVRDGMNLVAKEYIAAQDPEDPGVLVLSSLAGAAVELTDALVVNPNDIRAVAEAIQTALTLPRAERRERHRRMLETLRKNDIHAWHTRFLRRLESSARIRAHAGGDSIGPSKLSSPRASPGSPTRPV